MATYAQSIARRVIRQYEGDTHAFATHPEYKKKVSYDIIRSAAWAELSRLPREALMVIIWNADDGYEAFVPGTELYDFNNTQGKPGRWWMRRHALAAVLFEIRRECERRVNAVPLGI